MERRKFLRMSYIWLPAPTPPWIYNFTPFPLGYLIYTFSRNGEIQFAIFEKYRMMKSGFLVILEFIISPFSVGIFDIDRVGSSLASCRWVMFLNQPASRDTRPNFAFAVPDTNTNTQKYKYENTNKQIQVQKYKWCF